MVNVIFENGFWLINIFAEGTWVKKFDIVVAGYFCEFLFANFSWIAECTYAKSNRNRNSGDANHR